MPQVTREIQIKTTVTCHFTLVRIGIINKSKNSKYQGGRTWRKVNPFALLVEMQTGADTVESSMEIPQKIKNGSAF